MRGMLTAATIAGLFLGSTLWAVVTDMCKDEARARLGRIPFSLLRLAALRVPCASRSYFMAEWDAELEFILRGTDGLPVTRLLRGIRYSASLLLGGTSAVAREIAAAEDAAEWRPGYAPPFVADVRWSNLFPSGRDIYYEGDDPAGFTREIEAEFGFSPANDPHWGALFGGDEPGFTSYRFHCPPEHLDAIYGSSRFPMGS